MTELEKTINNLDASPESILSVIEMVQQIKELTPAFKEIENKIIMLFQKNVEAFCKKWELRLTVGMGGFSICFPNAVEFQHADGEYTGSYIPSIDSDPEFFDNYPELNQCMFEWRALDAINENTCDQLQYDTRYGGFFERLTDCDYRTTEFRRYYHKDAEKST